MNMIALAWLENVTMAASVAIGHYRGLAALPLLLLFFVSGCNESDPSSVAVPTPLPAITVEGESQIAAADVAQLPTGTDRQLVIWAPEFFQPALDVTTNGMLTTVYEQFERNHPGVHIEVQIRADSGEAGLLNYLRNAQRVAPAILPDLILIDAQQLWQVADLELLLPITQQQIGAGFQFYPFATNAVSADGQLLGVPYTADLIHLAYDPAQIATPPRLWSEFLTADQSFIFAAGNAEIFNSFTYLQYLGLGGDLRTTAALDSDLLLPYFSFLADAQTLGQIPEAVLDIATLDAAWEAMLMPDRGMAETSTHVLLKHWEMINSGTIGYAPLMTKEGIDLSVARVWSFAIVAGDAEQQELSLTLIRDFLHPTVQSQWNRVAMQLPTQPAAFELWRNPSPYYDFLQKELAVTQALPYGRQYAELMRRLQSAQELVLRKEMTPGEAVLYLQTTP